MTLCHKRSSIVGVGVDALSWCKLPAICLILVRGRLVAMQTLFALKLAFPLVMPYAFAFIS
jgi:hypothetical protein